MHNRPSSHFFLCHVFLVCCRGRNKFKMCVAKIWLFCLNSNSKHCVYLFSATVVNAGFISSLFFLFLLFLLYFVISCDFSLFLHYFFVALFLLFLLYFFFTSLLLYFFVFSLFLLFFFFFILFLLFLLYFFFYFFVFSLFLLYFFCFLLFSSIIFCFLLPLYFFFVSSLFLLVSSFFSSFVCLGNFASVAGNCHRIGQLLEVCDELDNATLLNTSTKYNTLDHTTEVNDRTIEFRGVSVRIPGGETINESDLGVVSMPPYLFRDLSLKFEAGTNWLLTGPRYGIL